MRPVNRWSEATAVERDEWKKVGTTEVLDSVSIEQLLSRRRPLDSLTIGNWFAFSLFKVFIPISFTASLGKFISVRTSFLSSHRIKLVFLECAEFEYAKVGPIPNGFRLILQKVQKQVAECPAVLVIAAILT